MDDDVRAEIRRARHSQRVADLHRADRAPSACMRATFPARVSSPCSPTPTRAKSLQKDGSRTEEEVVDYAVQMWRDSFGDCDLPDYFVNAQTLAPARSRQRCKLPHKNGSTAPFPRRSTAPKISFRCLQRTSTCRRGTGCKGCTTYRPNDVTGSVLSVSEKNPRSRPSTGEHRCRTATSSICRAAGSPAVP